MHILVSAQMEYTKEDFNFWMDRIASSKTILFLIFQIVQNRHRGPTFQTFFLFLLTNDPLHLSKVCLTELGKTQRTPKKEKKSSHKTPVNHSEVTGGLLFLPFFDTGNTYSLNVFLSSASGPKLNPFPTLPPMQRSKS